MWSVITSSDRYFFLSLATAILSLTTFVSTEISRFIKIESVRCGVVPISLRAYVQVGSKRLRENRRIHYELNVDPRT